MSLSAAVIRELVHAGLEGEALVGACERIEESDGTGAVVIRDEQAERRRAKDRERKRLRNSAESAEVPSPDKETPPTPPKETNPNPIPPSAPKGASSPAGFDGFWAEYPHKVGKADARKAWGRAVQRASLEAIMAGLERYRAKTDDRPWCNPATWLNQDRWEDEPATVQPRGSPQKPMTASQLADQISRDDHDRSGLENQKPDYLQLAGPFRAVG